MPKKKWKKPKLIVLYRGKPEEGVLVSCKGGLAPGGSGSYFLKCEAICSCFANMVHVYCAITAYS